MHDASSRIDSRIRNFANGPLQRQLYRASTSLSVCAWEVPGEPVPFAEAVAADYTPIAVGARWSRPWGTTWLRLTADVPPAFRAADGCRVEAVIDLGFNDATSGFQAEGTAWRPDGTLIKGIEPRNNYIPIAAGVNYVELYVEAASNPAVPTPDFITATPVGDLTTAGDEPIYTLRRLDIALLDEAVWELAQDVSALHGLVEQLPDDSVRRHEILFALERMLDRVDPDDLAATAGEGRQMLAAALSQPAVASAHRVHAVGHAHIDSAWLWPVRETIRKCSRTFSNVLALMDDDPDLTFACSSAQQYTWMKQHYPDLYLRIAERVREGRFIPVGGMWVESDTNMPGGEALVRQFLLGTTFFIDEFGIEPKEVWLPDSFGYTAAMPQIAVAAGKEYFLTQKMSWSDTNRFPHHTFWWEGIDGTRIFTHFPPVDTYNATLSAEELLRAQRQYREKGKANTSLVPFGWGDGGGGPTREMMAAARRYTDLEGAPKVTVSTPQIFFDTARREYPGAPIWSGELYLEYHRGTYTSQHRTKDGNRRCEHLLREAELWAAAAAVRTGADYPAGNLKQLWEQLLLQQFHDILPGTSIAWVHQEAEEHYGRITAALEESIAGSLQQLTGLGEMELVANARPFADGPVMASAIGVAEEAGTAPTLERDGGEVVLGNDALQVRVGAAGEIVSIIDRIHGRELVAPGEAFARLRLHRDIPNEWDAWDISDSYRHIAVNLTDCTSLESYRSGSEVGVRVERKFGDSVVRQEVALAAASTDVVLRLDIDWHEHQKLLKLVFPFDLRATYAASEIQFGHVNRPVHANTSWDQARFESVAHRWIHLAEPGFGVAITNSSTYGYDITSERRHGGGTITVIGASVLRAPIFPDPYADHGHHSMQFSISPATTPLDAAEAGYRRNLPTRMVSGAHPVKPLVTVDDPGLVVESIKLAEDGLGDVVIRLYEARGGRIATVIRLGFDATDAKLTDLLERPLQDQCALHRTDDGHLAVQARPFQIVTVRICRS